jgi:hypothetical protein
LGFSERGSQKLSYGMDVTSQLARLFILFFVFTSMVYDELHIVSFRASQGKMLSTFDIFVFLL